MSRFGDELRYRGVDLDELFRAHPVMEVLKDKILLNIQLAEMDIGSLKSQVSILTDKVASLSKDLALSTTKCHYLSGTLGLRHLIESQEARYLSDLSKTKFRTMHRTEKWMLIMERQPHFSRIFYDSGFQSLGEIAETAHNLYSGLSKTVHEHPYEDGLVLSHGDRPFSPSENAFINGLASITNVNIMLEEDLR